MDDHTFLNQLEDLRGKVAIVTGGAGGIGLECTLYLAAKGCTVYVASRNKEKSLKGIEDVKRRLSILVPPKQQGEIKFHQLDLSTMNGAVESAKAFRSMVDKVDIVIANAAVNMQGMDELSPDGWEKTFATNHLGHFAFITTLLPTIEETAKADGEARIVMVSSGVLCHGVYSCDYKALTTAIPKKGKSILDTADAMKRYGNSKLANAYMANELSRRLRARGVENVYVNSCHPGASASTGLVFSGTLTWFTKQVFKLVTLLLTPFMNTNNDSARTQTWLAASKKVREDHVTGQFWWPQFKWTNRYIGCKRNDGSMPAFVKDQNEAKNLWVESEKAMKKAGLM